MTEKMKPSGIAWIGDIPSGWGAKRIKYVISDIKDGTHGTFDRVESGELLLSAKNVFDDGIHIGSNESEISYSDYTSIVANGFPQRNDVLLCCVGTIGRCCVYNFEKPLAFQRSVSFLRPLADTIPSFLKYALQSDSTTVQEQLLLNKSAQEGLYMGSVREMVVAMPDTVSEQRAIADFLDTQCAKIDSVIADIEKQIETLQKYKKSLITEAVTKGLERSVPTKNSGIDWIGEIPVHWKTIPLKYLFSLYAGGDVNEYDFSDEQTEKYKYPIYSNSLENHGLFGYTSKYRFSGKTFTVTGRGEVGKAVPRFDSYYPIVRLLACIPKNNANNEYYAYCVNSADVLGDQTAMAQLTTQKLGMLVVPLPSADEQKRISDYLNNQCAKTDAVIDQKREQLSILLQHKKSLIYEYVTGKKRVAEVN